MKSIRGILFDVDDTLYSHKQHRIPELTKYTIKKLKENGYILGMCTSRFPREFCSLPENIFDDFDLIIAGTGSIYIRDGKVLHIEKINESDTQKYINYLDQQDSLYYLWAPVEGQPHFSSEPGENIKRHHLEWAKECPTVQKWNKEVLCNIVYYGANEKQTQEITDLVGETGLEIWGNNGHINPKNIDKAYGIKYFSKLYNLDLKEILCFGDGINDISMIKTAGMGVAVGNGKDELKKQADYICDPIENAGIYTFCVDHHLIDPIDPTIFFFDIDGTTFRNDIQASPESTISTIHALRKKGKKCCICTSRSSDEMIHLPKTFLNMFDAIIRLAGGHITIDGKDFYHEVNHDEVCQAIKYLDQNKIPYRYVTVDEKSYLYNSTEFVRGLFKYQYGMIPPEKKYENEKVIHLQYYPYEESQNDDLDKIFMKSKVTHLNISHEITQENTDKGSAILRVAEYYGYNRENTVAFGDGENDITMLKNAQIGIAMGNACQQCLDVADYVTERIEDDGLYNACKHFKWIES